MRVVCQSWLRWHHFIVCSEDKARNETAIWATGRCMTATSIKLLASSSFFLSLSIPLCSSPANILNMFVTSNFTVLDSCYYMINDSSAIKFVFLYILHQIWKKQQYLLMPLILRKRRETKVELSRNLFALGQIIKVLFRLWCASWPIQLPNTINLIYLYPFTDGFWKNKTKQSKHHKGIWYAYFAWSGFKGKGHQTASSLTSFIATFPFLITK